jgi:mono/diheme cytochrome c family protein
MGQDVMQTQRSVAWLAGLGMVGVLFGCSQNGTAPSSGAPAGPPPGPADQKGFDVESGPFAAGKKVFLASGCFRCHAIDGVRGPGGAPPGPTRGAKGPDLGKVGRDPKHSVEWLEKFVRNPKAVRDNARMPPFEGQIKEDDLHALAEFLASLKGGDAS